MLKRVAYFLCVFIFAATYSPLGVLAEEQLWDLVEPYLLPKDHRCRNRLDKIFANPDVLSSLDSLEKAGFKTKKHAKWDNVVVASHKKLEGYLIKTFTDDQVGIVEGWHWLKRIEGANAIRAAIDRHGFDALFKVPQKWIYQVPRHSLDPNIKHLVLIVEDMRLCDAETNALIWKSSNHLSKETLQALFILLQDEGLKDSVYIDNIPFCKDGKIAFIDTEHFHSWPVAFAKLKKWLPTSLQGYWVSLYTQNN